jgi:hypothetical protein
MLTSRDLGPVMRAMVLSRLRVTSGQEPRIPGIRRGRGLVTWAWCCRLASCPSC